MHHKWCAGDLALPFKIGRKKSVHAQIFKSKKFVFAERWNQISIITCSDTKE